MTDSLWSAPFTATITAIFDAAEADLRALGVGKIERGEMAIALAIGNRQAIRLEFGSGCLPRPYRVFHCLRVRFSVPALLEQSGDDTRSFADDLVAARRNLAVVELADRWVQRWGSMRWSEDDVYDAEAKAQADAKYEHERKVASAAAILTDRRREVLIKAIDGIEWNAADRRVAKSIPDLVDDNAPTRLGKDVVAHLREGG